MAAYVELTCWYGGEGVALGQCEVASEEPAGCGIGAAAVQYFNSGIDMSPTYHRPDLEDRARWVQVTAYRDAAGRVGRKFFRKDVPFIFEERPFREKQ